ncbi:MAG: zeta toxin family protein [Vulcanococcus sp.]
MKATRRALVLSSIGTSLLELSRSLRRHRLVLLLVGAWALAVQAGTIHAAPLPPRPAAGAGGGTAILTDKTDPNRPLEAQEQRGLNGEQRRVQLQSLAAVRADPEAWIGRYLERITTVRAASGAVVRAGTRDLAEAMRRGPLTISADEAKELFPAFATDNRSRSQHSASVHGASLLLTDRLWQRALAQPLNPERTLVLFSGGGVASGKTYALRNSEAVRQLMASTQIVQDSTMANRRRAQSRIDQALATGRPVQLIYVFTPIEQSVRWLVDRGMRAGRAVSAAATARSHWDSQETVLALADHYRGHPAVRIGLLVNAIGGDGRLRSIEDLRVLRLAADRRFPDQASLQRHVAALIQRELQARRRDADPADPSPELEHSLLVVE